MSLAHKKKASVPEKAGLPPRLCVIRSCADRTTGWRELTRWLPKCVFNACVCGENGWPVHILLLYKRRQQLLSVVFSLFL